MADFAEHFQVKTGTLLQPLGFHQLAHTDQLFEPIRQLGLDGFDCRQDLVSRCHVMAGRIDCKARNFLPNTTCQRVEELQAFNFVVEQFDANGQLGMLCGKHINRIAPDPKFASTEIHVIALVLHADELCNHVALT